MMKILKEDALFYLQRSRNTLQRELCTRYTHARARAHAHTHIATKKERKRKKGSRKEEKEVL